MLYSSILGPATLIAQPINILMKITVYRIQRSPFHKLTTLYCLALSLIQISSSLMHISTIFKISGHCRILIKPAKVITTSISLTLKTFSSSNSITTKQCKPLRLLNFLWIIYRKCSLTLSSTIATSRLICLLTLTKNALPPNTLTKLFCNA